MVRHGLGREPFAQLAGDVVTYERGRNPLERKSPEYRQQVPPNDERVVLQRRLLAPSTRSTWSRYRRDASSSATRSCASGRERDFRHRLAQGGFGLSTRQADARPLHPPQTEAALDLATPRPPLAVPRLASGGVGSQEQGTGARGPTRQSVPRHRAAPRCDCTGRGTGPCSRSFYPVEKRPYSTRREAPAATATRSSTRRRTSPRCSCGCLLGVPEGR